MIASLQGYCTCEPMKGCDVCGATSSLTQHTRSNTGPIMGHVCYECYRSAVERMWAEYSAEE
jgi:hypothetical protein